MIQKSKNYCVDCGVELKTKKSKRCYSCSSKYRISLNPQTKENNYNWKGGKPKCLDCGKELSRRNYKLCNSCNRKGKLHSNYINGDWIGKSKKDLYGEEFNNELKEQIRKRDSYTCQICGITEEEHLIVFGCVLSVHHIDYDKLNSSNYNLLSLCSHCHTRTNFNRDYWKKKLSKVNIYDS